MLISRRSLLAGIATSAALPALAQQDWRQSVKEIRFGVSSAENEAAALARTQPVIEYLAARLGVPVKLYRVSDYAGLVEAMRADQLEFSRFGPAVYSLGRRILGDKLQPLFRDIDNNGQEGYFSVILVRSDSPYQSVADLKGKSFAFADPNSTSGYAFPSYFLRKQGLDPQTLFGGTVFSGSHDNSVIALVRGQFDGVATYQVNAESGVAQRLAKRGMIPAALDPRDLDLAADPGEPVLDPAQPARGAEGRFHRRDDGDEERCARGLADLHRRACLRLCTRPPRGLSRRHRGDGAARGAAEEEGRRVNAFIALQRSCSPHAEARHRRVSKDAPAGSGA